MNHMHCSMCKWVAAGSTVEILIAAYLVHVIREHWDILQEAHDNPSMLDEAMQLVMEES